jgi:hypothetical protein
MLSRFLTTCSRHAVTTRCPSLTGLAMNMNSRGLIKMLQKTVGLRCHTSLIRGALSRQMQSRRTAQSNLAPTADYLGAADATRTL